MFSFAQPTRAVVNFFILFSSFLLRSLAFTKQNKGHKNLIGYYANISYLIMMMLPVFIVIRAISHHSVLLASTSGTYCGGEQVETMGIPLHNALYCANAQVISMYKQQVHCGTDQSEQTLTSITQW